MIKAIKNINIFQWKAIFYLSAKKLKSFSCMYIKVWGLGVKKYPALET